jgi:hypothetical protein
MILLAPRSIVRERNIAVTRLPADVFAHPIGRLESLAAFFIWEFYFRDDQAIVPAAVDVDFNGVLSPRNFVTDFG